MPKNSQAKARALRIPLGSHTHDPLAKWRNFLTLAAVSICGGWLLAGTFGGQSGRQKYSPGPVSSAHAQLSCDSCHDHSSPLRDATFLSSWKTGTDDSTELWHRRTDSMCKACHPVNGAEQVATGAFSKSSHQSIGQLIPISAHSDNQINNKVDSCASCHAEHRGFDMDPSLVPDRACVGCHQNLHEFRASDKQNIATGITGFDMDNHPPFTSLEHDRGAIKFDHRFHLTPGLLEEGGQIKLTKTLADYPNHAGRLSNYTDSSGNIVLNCQFCHQPTDRATSDSVNSPGLHLSGALPGLESGDKYMTMPNYEQHCQVCHSIDLVPPVELNFTSNLAIEHGAPREQLVNDLMVYFSLEAMAPAEIKQQIPEKILKLPGRVPPRLWDIQSPPASVPERARDFLADAETKVRTNCLFCHLAADVDSGMGIPEIMKATSGDAQIRFANVFNSNWFEHGRFDHSAHRDVSCAHCHEMNSGKTPLVKSNLDLGLDKPMIKDIESCVECHQSPGNVTPPFRPGPTNCISCHTYHGGGNRK